MANTLIIGGAGFMGSNLAEHLLAAGHAVRVLDRPGAVSPLPATIRNRLDWVEADFTAEGAVGPALVDIDYVFHLASTTLPQTSNEQPIYDIETNLCGAVRLIQAVRRAKVRRLMFASSGGTVYGVPRTSPISENHPTSPLSSYGVVKLAIENYLDLFRTLHGLDYVTLRIANPYGPYQRTEAAQGAVGVFVARALAGVPIEIWGDGTVVRDFVHVSDVSTALIFAMEGRGDYRVFNVGSGRGRSLNDVVDAIESAIGRKVAVNYSPGRVVDVPANVLDVSRIRDAYGWVPQVTFEDGVRAIVSAVKKEA